MSALGDQKTPCFEEAVEILRKRLPNKVHAGGLNLISEANIEAVRADIIAAGLRMETAGVEANLFDSYRRSAEYGTRYPQYYELNQGEKAFEHYWAYRFIEPKAGCQYVDIGSEHSPLPEIFDRLSGSITYSQDLSYEPGIAGKQIGGDAAQLPVPDAFFDGVVATCSIEHFEGNSDIGFMKEVARVLKPGGKIIVLPLYINATACYYVDPVCAVLGDAAYEPEHDIYCEKGWGNRFGRFYSAATLRQRLIDPNPELSFAVQYLKDANSLGPSVYCRFALFGIKKS